MAIGGPIGGGPKGATPLAGGGSSATGVPPTGHRYWRLNLTAPISGTAYGLAEITMETSVGGANVATGGTAAASTTYSSSYAASYAFDANAATFWASLGSSAAEWISYDFGAGITRAIVEFSFTSRPDSAASSQTPLSGSLQYSDDNTTWTTAFGFTGSGSVTSGQKQTFVAPLPYRASLIAAEVLLAPLASARIENVAAEVLIAPLTAARIENVAAEILIAPLTAARISNVAAEVLLAMPAAGGVRPVLFVVL